MQLEKLDELPSATGALDRYGRKVRELRRRNPEEPFRKDNTSWADLCYQFRVDRPAVQLVEHSALALLDRPLGDKTAVAELERAAHHPAVDPALDLEAVQHCATFRLLSVSDLRVRKFCVGSMEYGLGYAFDDYGRSSDE